jgi:hypothetical protein
MSANTSHAVMAQRTEPHNSLDDFPTPPWATRALMEHIDRWGDVSDETCWEPACNRGHMAKPLREYFKTVHTSDVHDYSAEWDGQDRVCDFLFLNSEPPHIAKNGVDWIITNPPFRLAEQFALRAFEIAREGVALFVRLAFLESIGRYEGLFSRHRPEWILQFSERVVLHKGRLAPEGSTATAYCWVIWLHPFNKPCRFDGHHFPAFVWIPPCRARLELTRDYETAA